MKAIVQTKYGSPDVLRLEEVEKPAPEDDEILIKVRAATVGPADCAFRKGEPFIVKLLYGLGRPRLRIPGVEFAGEVEAVGKNAESFEAGDRVFGLSPKNFGAHAEYVCLPEGGPVAVKSAGMSYEEAVGVCDGALTALTFLRDKARVRSGQKVLVNGASGAVGAYAAQLAGYYGAEVTGVCGAANLELVESLGADEVIDYAKEDFAKRGRRYDVIFDAVGKSSFSRCKNALEPGGVYLSTVPSIPIVLQTLWTSLFGGKKAVFTAAGLQQSKENLAFLKELFEAGEMKAVIDRRYPLERISEAHAYVETGRKKGNVIITLEEHG